jgi:hypothetical protein
MGSLSNLASLVELKGDLTSLGITFDVSNDQLQEKVEINCHLQSLIACNKKQ